MSINNLKQSSDESLTDLIHNGLQEENCFDELYARHSTRVLAFLSSRVSSSDLDDIHQQIWVKVWNALKRKPFQGHFRGWVFQISRNSIIDHARQKKNQPSLQVDENIVDSANPLIGMLDEERMTTLEGCLQHLSDLAARVIRARLGGENYDLICRNTNLQVERAHRIFHDAKKQLQQCVKLK
jgi:RNA polymerase sigma-70 factor (ECF subfamily)